MGDIIEKIKENKRRREMQPPKKVPYYIHQDDGSIDVPPYVFSGTTSYPQTPAVSPPQPTNPDKINIKNLGSLLETIRQDVLQNQLDYQIIL